MNRLSRGIAKMNPGTIGGQSRVATKASRRMISKSSVVPTPAESLVDCVDTGWMLTASGSFVGLTTLSVGFDPDSDFVWTVDSGSVAGLVQRRHYATMAMVSTNVEDRFFPNPGGSFTNMGVAVTFRVDPPVGVSGTRVWVIGYNGANTRGQLWRWDHADPITPTWSGTLMWQGELLSGSEPSVVYNPSDQQVYLRYAYDSVGVGATVVVVSVDVDSPGWFAPGGGGQLIFAEPTPTLFNTQQIAVAADGRVVWPVLDHDGNVSTVFSYDGNDTASLITSPHTFQWLVHSPTDLNRFVLVDFSGVDYWEIPSDLSSAPVEVAYPELMVSPEAYPMGPALSHDNLRAVFLAWQFDATGGQWYRSEFCP